MARRWDSKIEEAINPEDTSPRKYKVTDEEINKWNNKQDALQYDEVPTEGSTNVMTSTYIKRALDSFKRIITEEYKRYFTVRADEITRKDTSARIGEVVLPAYKWSGSGSLHSQVVTIAGVTANSQVDLTPSAEQLADFYEKNITFVTENEDGTVTVYVVGQRPQQDYIIQATITEVTYE